MNNPLSTCARASFQLFKDSGPKVKALSALDFTMQVQPNWNFYLFYTAIRCSVLAYKYKTGLELPVKVWKEAQLYSSMKVVGLVVSQAALLTLGLTTPPAAALILGWGGCLASMSCYAHHRSLAQSV